MAKTNSKKSTKTKGRSTKKQKNIVSLIFDAATIVLGALLLGFLALPHVNYVVAGEVSKAYSAYNFLGYNANAWSNLGFTEYFAEGAIVATKVLVIMLIIFASLMILCGLLKVLCDTYLVTNKTLVKVVGMTNVITALATLLLAMVVLIVVASCAKNEVGEIIKKVTGAVAVWATLIVNTCLAVGAVGTSVLSLKK